MEGFKKRWDGEMFYNNSEKKGRWVAVLIRRNVCDNVTEIYSDNEGQILTVKLQKENEEIIMCNIQAPNEDKDSGVF